MKLEPKARPVQINKLRLGGKDINSIDDLLKNFCLSEILELGDKFTQWLNRNGEVVKAKGVNKILNDLYDEEQKAVEMLRLFFPLNFKGKDKSDFSLENLLLVWQESGVNTEMYKGILNCITLNEEYAIRLMHKSDIKDKSWMLDWLKKCSEKYANSKKFFKEYAQFYKENDQEGYREWIKLEKKEGNVLADKLLEQEDTIDILVNGFTITMLRIKDDNGDFYIAKNVLYNAFVKSLGFRDNAKSYYGRDECDNIITELNRKTGFQWRYPTRRQWHIATNTMRMTPRQDKQTKEWCREKSTSKNYFYIAPAGASQVQYYMYDAYLRPVLEIKDNKELQ